MAASPSTVTTLDYALKEYYSEQRVESLTLSENVLTDLLDKDTMTGDVLPLPVIYASPQGIGNTSFSGVQGNKTSATGVKWNITLGDMFGYIELGDKALKAAEGNMGSFLDHTMTEIDELLQQMGNDYNAQVWGNGGGALGQRASIATDTVTLTNKFDVTNFEVGMTVTASANDGSGSAHTQRAGSTTIASLDYEAGTVTLASAAAITGFANSDYIFRQYAFAGDQSQTAIVKGLQAWVPSSAPSSTSFFGVDRTPSTKLSGYRLPSTAATGTIEERFRKLATRMYRQFGTKPKYGFLEPENWERLAQNLENNGFREITVKNATGSYGYDGLKMRGNSFGSIEILADRHCPTATGWMINPKHMKLRSYRKLFHPMNEDGFKMLRVNNAAAYECRYVNYSQLTVQKPSDVGRAAMPSVTY